MRTDRAAFDHCADITRTHAANSWHGIRRLVPENRDAFCATYAFARRVREIAEGCAPSVDRLAALAAVRDSMRHSPGATGDPVLRALGTAMRRLPMPMTAVDGLIAGFAAEVSGRPLRRWDDTFARCRAIAGSVGRLSLGALGDAGEDGRAELAEALGVAFRLTTMLRDLNEDLRSGKIYWPGVELGPVGDRPMWSARRPTAGVGWSDPSRPRASSSLVRNRVAAATDS